MNKACTNLDNSSRVHDLFLCFTTKDHSQSETYKLSKPNFFSYHLPYPPLMRPIIVFLFFLHHRPSQGNPQKQTDRFPCFQDSTCSPMPRKSRFFIANVLQIAAYPSSLDLRWGRDVLLDNNLPHSHISGSGSKDRLCPVMARRNFAGGISVG